MRQIKRSAWVLALSAGVLQILIFPSPGLYFLCWIAVAPLLLALLRARAPVTVQLPDSLARGTNLLPATAGQGFVLGYLAGLIWYGGTCYWVYHVMHLYGGLSAIVSAGLLVLFCLYLALYHGLFGLVAALIAGAGNPRVAVRRTLIAVPFLWVAVELARTRITGFPWDLLGTAQVYNIPLARIATVTGVYGLSFEILLVNAAFAAAFLARWGKRRTTLIAAILVTVVVQGTTFFHPPAFPVTETARLVQANVPILDSSEWTPEYYLKTISQFREKSLPNPQMNMGEPIPSLIVWPESPAPFYVNDPVFRRSASEIAKHANAYLITGSIGTNTVPEMRGAEIYNSAMLVSPSGQWTARYDKVHLVPFGEYVPFRDLLSFAKKLTREVGEFVPGAQRNVFDLGTYKAGVFICYESIFPSEISQFAKNGAEVFVNISNDGWFGNSGAAEQHLNMARMRAIENNRWLLRATNTGITVSIDPYGRVVTSAPRNVSTALDAPFGVVTQTTFYTRYGDWFAYSCAIITVVALLLRFRTKSRAILS